MRNLILSLLLVLSMIGTAGANDKKDTAVEPTSWGKVMGQIYDAGTGSPIAGASVVIQNEGAFTDKGKTAGKTDPMGRYQCNAVIGRVSSNINIGDVLLSSPLSLLFGGGKNTTKRVDISRLNLRVTMDGYKSFEGVVMCRETDPEKFNVKMQPILMASTSGAEVSTTADGWGVVRITDVSVEPKILRPGMKAVITVIVKSPFDQQPHDLHVRYLNGLNDRDSYLGREIYARGKSGDGELTFTGDITAPKVKTLRVGPTRVWIEKCPVDVAKDEAAKYVLLQVVTTDAEEKAAGIREEAFRLSEANENVEAASRLKELCALPEAQLWDSFQLAKISAKLHDTATAVSEYSKVVDLTPAKPQETRFDRIGDYATALVADNQGAKVLTDYVPLVDTIKVDDRPYKVPVPLMVAIGNAYLQQDKLVEAEAVSQSLLKYSNPYGYQGTDEFRNALKLAEAQAKLKSDPNSAQGHVDYGHALMDQGRWEEAVTELRAAVQADGNQPAVQRDLTYAILHIKGGETEARKGLDEALATSEKATQITDSKGKLAPTKDFFAWHTYSVMLYCKARQQQNAQDSGAAATFEKCRGAIRNALKCGRTGAAFSPGKFAGQYGYLGGTTVSISGFAYPEADSDFVLLEGLSAVEKHPDDYLVHFNVGTALIDLGQADMADASIRRALELKPDCTEAKYAAALIALQLGDRDVALADLKEVLQANPRHSHANLTLAKLYTEDGDTASAATCLAAHSRYYGVAK